MKNIRLVILDSETVTRGDVSLDGITALADSSVFGYTPNEKVAEAIGDADAVICNKCLITQEVFDKCPNLKYVGLFATGYNNVDLAAASRRGAVVCNVPAYSTNAVAQHTFALILDYYNKVAEYKKTVADGDWVNYKLFSYFYIPTTEIAGLTLGIIGYGDIGRKTAEIARAFGMNVVTYTRSPQKVTDGTRVCTLEELLSISDAVSLHCPLTDQTRYMINGDAIGKMKPGVILINTGRGQLIHTEALIDGLKEKKIGAAGLDVYEEEAGYFYEDTSDRIMDDDVLARLLSFNNVIVTSHQGFFTREAVDNIARTTMQNIKDFSECRRLENEVRAEPENAVGQL